jgi:H+/Cl- antiporter ClcA
MKKQQHHYVKELLVPCLFFSAVTGIFSALLIAIFKWAASGVIGISERAYAFVRANPAYIPLLIGAAALIGLVSSFILSFSHSCRGGGIPTSIAAIRGITRLKWQKSVFLLPVSALLTFLCGVPLGTEGPCVQMGTALGDGTVKLLGGKKYAGWRRYMMTGGASAGFSLATGAPITAIMFSLEELHRRFSPLLFTVAAITVAISQLTAELLSLLGFGSLKLFHVEPMDELSLKLIIIPLTIGILCGLCSIFFTKFYTFTDKKMKAWFGKISVKLKFPIIFAAVAVIGFFFAKILGTGHGLIDHLLGDHLYETHTLWYFLIIVFVTRSVLMMVSNTAGVTGGIFLPTLAFGAIIGAICAEAFIAMGLIGAEHYVLSLVIGMVSFLGATSRIPVTACVFAIEALAGINNILLIIIAVTAAFLCAELSGTDDFTHTVIKHKAHSIHAGKEPTVIEAPLMVYKGAFVVGKELNDVLWPADCVVLSREKGPVRNGRFGLEEGDVITVRYTTYDPVATAEEFEVLVGDQPEHVDRIMRPDS